MHFESLYREDLLRDFEIEDYFLDGIHAMVTNDMNKDMVSFPSVEEIKGSSVPLSPPIRPLAQMDSQPASIKNSGK